MILSCRTDPNSCAAGPQQLVLQARNNWCCRAATIGAAGPQQLVLQARNNWCCRPATIGAACPQQLVPHLTDCIYMESKLKSTNI